MTITDVSEQSPPPGAYPEIVAELESVGFRVVGRVARTLPGDGLDRMARQYAAAQRDELLVRSTVPSTGLVAADGSAYAEVDWFWDSPHVALMTELADGSVAVTRRRWESVPPWPRNLRLGRAAASLPGEMLRNDVARGGRSERIADGDVAALWAAHRAHVADYGRTRACSPVSHRDVHGLVTVLSRLWQHDVAVARRTQVAHGVLLVVLGVALVATTPPVAVALLGLAVVVLVVSPVLYARLRYVRLWRPAFV